MALSIGIVKDVKGLVIDTNSHGKDRVLKVGDVVNVEDTIDTVGAASKIVLALTDGQELSIGGNDGVFLDKSVYGTESFGNDAVASSEIMKDILPGESIEDIQKALLSGEDINNLAPTAAGETTHSELGTSGEAQYLQGGSESNVQSSLRDSGDTTQNNTLSFSPVNTPDINDAPVANDDTGVAREAGSAGDEGLYIAPISAVGNVLDNDTDIDNLHSNLSITNVNGHDVPTSGDIALAGIYGTLNIHSDGSYTYVANDSNQAVNALAAGESIQESFTYTLSDNDSINPKTDNGNLSIVINGSNDAPVVTSATSAGSVTEDATAQSTATGDISFSDVDLSDTHTVTSSRISTSTDYGVNMGTFSVVENSDTTGSGTGGSATWTYHINNSAAQQLAAGQSVTETYSVTVADDGGKTSTQDVTVTITGTNDAPILSAQNTTGSVTDDITNPTLTDSGNISFTDVDLTDNHTVHVETNPSNLGTLNAVVTESPNSSSGTVDWTYSVPSSQTEYLGAGETKVESFTVAVDDGNGGVSIQTINITVEGTNNQPVVSDVDVNGTGFLNRFTGDSTSATYYNNGSNSYAGMDYATVPNDRVQRIDSTHAQFALDTRLPSGSEDWDGARIYLHQGEVLTLTSNSGSNDYYLGIDDSDHSNGTPDPVTGAFRWDALALTTDAGQSVSLTANSDGWYYIGAGAVSGPNSPYGLYDTTVTITGETGNIIYEVDTGLNTFTSTFPPAQDADVNDTLTYDIVDNSLSATTSSAAVVTNLGVEVTDPNTGAYKVTGDFNSLAVGETATVTFQYTANDGHGFDGTDGVNQSSISDPATVTLTITGTNDAPILSAQNITGSVTEDATNPTLTDSGNISFTDVDLSDTHTVHVGTNPGNIGTLSAVVSESSNSSNGTVDWTYSVPNSQAQYLGAGETKVESFTVAVDDGNGGVSTQTVSVTITGTNDAPVIINPGDTNMTFLSETAGYNNVLGVYTFDADGNPTNPQIVLTGTNDPSNLGVSHALGLPMGSFGLFLISNGETTYPDIANSNISFDLSGTNPVLLVNGVASTRPVYFDNNQWNSDGHDHFDTTTNPDGSLTIAMEDLSMGDNDRADLIINLKSDGNSVGGTVVEIADGTPGENVDDISTSGTLSFADPDLSDIHTVVATPSDSGYIGTFTPIITTPSTGSGQGEIKWSFSVNDSLVDHLGADESIVQTYSVEVSDGHGGVVTQDVSIVIQGTNDRPIAAVDSGTTTENAPLTIDVLANDTDADTHDAISINSFDHTTSGGGAVSLVGDKLVFDPGHDFDYLGVGETATVTFQYTAKDNSLYMTPGSVTAQHGISDPTTVTLTITGTNDAPIAVASNGEFNENQLSEPTVPVQGSENLLTGLIDPDTSDTNHIIGKVSTTDGSYQDVDSGDGTLVKVGFDFTDAHGNQETIFIPVRVNQDGTYDVSQNQLLDRIPQGTDATGSFWYKIDDGHTQDNLSQGQQFTINIHGQNDAPAFNITSLNNGDTTDDIPVTIKLSGDRFNSGSLDAPEFNILVDGHKLNDSPLTVEELRSYRIDNSLGTEPTQTSWEYVTFNVPNGAQNVEVQYIHDTWEGGHDVDGDGYSEDRNLIIDSLNIGGTIVTNSNGDVSVIGGTTLQAEDTTVATYTRSDGADESGREVMPWGGTMSFNVHDAVAAATPTDAFHTQTFSENTLTDANAPIVGDTNLLNGVNDIDGLKSDISVVQADGTNFTNPITVDLNVNDSNGNPLSVEVNVNSDGTYSVIPNSALNSLSAGTVAEGTFDFKAKDTNSGLSDDQTFTIRVAGTNDQPAVSDIDVNTLIHESRAEGNLGDFTPTLSETGETSPTFGAEQVQQTFNLGAEHAGQQVAIEFDMKELGTWDGDGTWNAAHEGAQEAFLAFVNGEKVVDKIMGLDGVDNNSNDGGTIIDGSAGTWNQTDLHHFSIQAVADANGDVTLGFGSTLHEGLSNESYSIDNLSIVSAPIYEANTGLNTFVSTFTPAQDADINDNHTYSIVDGSISSSVAGITDLSAIITDPNTGAYKVTGDFNSLAVGETATVTFQYTANDGHGFDGTDGVNQSSISDPATVTLTITGTNDAPVATTYSLVGSDNHDIFTYDGSNVPDTLLFQNDATVDFSQIASGNIKNIDTFDLTHANVSISNLNANDVLDMTDSNNIIKIDGDSHDTISSSSTWHTATSQTGVDAGYTRYESIADNHTQVFVDVKDAIVHTDF